MKKEKQESAKKKKKEKKKEIAIEQNRAILPLSTQLDLLLLDDKWRRERGALRQIQ